jgi:outer membrane cobalamin receptor
MNAKRLQCAVGLSLIPAFSAAPVYADKMNVEELLVTGSYSETQRENVSASITILDRADISALNKSHLVDVLRTVPGLLIEEQGGAGGLVSVSLRGGESNFTVVMIDGVQLNDPTNTRGGSFDFGNLGVDSIERIEIVRGAQSTIYGSDALSGVINTITTQPKAGHQQNLSTEVGEYGYRRNSIAVRGLENNLGYSLQLGKRNSGEAVDGSQQQSDDINAGLSWTPSKGQKIALNYRASDGELSSYPEQSGGPNKAENDDLYRSEYQGKSLGAAWILQLNSLWQSNLHYSQYERDESFDSPGIAPYMNVPPYFADAEFERKNLRWVNRIGDDQFWLHAGLERREEYGRSDGAADFGAIIPAPAPLPPLTSNVVLIPLSFELDRASKAAFLELNTRLASDTLIQIGARHDKPDELDTEEIYKLGIKQDFDDGFSLSANWGQGFKLPSFFALGDSLTGNPGLKPETAENWDITAEWNNKQQHLSLSYFDNHFENLITFDDVNFTNINSDAVDTSGAEFQWTWQLPQLPLSIQAETTYTDIDAEDPELKLTGRPQIKGGLNTRWQVNQVFSLSADYRYTGSQFAGSQHTGSGTTEKLKSYTTLDLSFGWQLLPQISLRGALGNALNKKFENAVGFPGEPRALRVGINFSFE